MALYFEENSVKSFVGNSFLLENKVLFSKKSFTSLFISIASDLFIFSSHFASFIGA